MVLRYVVDLRGAWQTCTQVCRKWRKFCWSPMLFNYFMYWRGQRLYARHREGYMHLFWQHPMQGMITPFMEYNRLSQTIRLEIIQQRKTRRVHVSLVLKLIGGDLLYPSRYKDRTTEGFVLQGDSVRSRYDNSRTFQRFMFSAEVLVPLFQDALRRCLQSYCTEAPLPITDLCPWITAPIGPPSLSESGLLRSFFTWQVVVKIR